jgi:SAM-dependent methyltransferase
MDFTASMRCRACGSSQLDEVLDLGAQPLANSYVRVPTDLPAYPLELMVCRECFQNQLSIVVNPDLMFQNYLYVSGTSRTLRNHFDSFVQQVLQWFPPSAKCILDLACNDGTLLEAFRKAGCTVTGVDPAANLVALAQTKGLPVVQGYWPRVRAEVAGPFDLITACNVLAHVDNPRSFLEAALDRLRPRGAIIVEFPYARTMILHSEWDTIYHEHLSYFLVQPFLRMLDGLGASVTHAQFLPIHGGSLRLAIQNVARGHCPEVLAMAEAEVRDGLTRLETYHRFAENVDRLCEELPLVVNEAESIGKRVIGFGASAKGNTLLNRCPISLAYIVDDNPLKHGYLTPGQNIPICAPAVLSEDEKDLAILLLAWNFAPEIIQKIRSWRPSRNDQAIHYVPSVFTHGIEEPLPPWFQPT